MLRLLYGQSGVSLVAAALLIVVHMGYTSASTPAPLLAAQAGCFAALLAIRARWRARVLRLDDATSRARSAGLEAARRGQRGGDRAAVGGRTGDGLPQG
ncbi:hypothetical protein LXT13_07980 [Pelomonas sp. P8]|uniref:Uncharacterized protein n=2 Tax=Pelomonas cellulosilytica TaxID=2906762 RepID=A0ABS8XYG2_9BURK|nr:hypothetical protein [Pelomonas sp. P8]